MMTTGCSLRCLFLSGVLVGSFALWTPPQAQAGISPENLIVVVNADSEDSRTIANHYVELRKIPSPNVIFLDDVPPELVTSLDAFRDRILKPLLAEIDKRGLANQVRAIAYSAGFPYGVKNQTHRERLKDETMNKIFTPVGSLNGMTFLFRFVLADREDYLSPTPNLYARMPWQRHFAQPFSGDDAAQFDKAQTALADEDFSTAAAGFVELLDKHPAQAPLGILAARALAKTDQPAEAMEPLNRAVKAGWTSGVRLLEDDAFEALRDHEDFQALVADLGDAPHATQHAVGFEATRGWTPNGWWTRADLGGMVYLPSCMLAVTRGKGTSVDEAVAYLTRAANADHTFPDGTVYFTSTEDVRTKTRLPQFAEAMKYLQWLGRDAEILSTAIPEQKKDVIGVTFGVANYDWPASESQFLPGALGDNLTSTSGDMRGSGQTKLTELLKAGAAMASGTVTEPYALPFKFPLPQLHGYYAEGATALEAYHLSVTSPYQLLLVGDPLCQPFARQPAEVIGAQFVQHAGGRAMLIKTFLPPDQAAETLDKQRTSPISEVEFYLEGKLVRRTTPQEVYPIKLDGLQGGSYELRTTLIGEPRLAPKKTILTWIDAKGLYPIPQVQDSEKLVATLTDTMRTVEFQAEAIGADSIRVMHFGTELTRIDSDQGQISVDLTGLGSGPIRLRLVADYRGQEVQGREWIVN